jgi:hypothetical protein
MHVYLRNASSDRAKNTANIDRKWFCTSVVVYNNITKCFYSLVASCLSGTTAHFRI